MIIVSIAEERPYRVPGTREYEQQDAIPGLVDRVRGVVSRRTVRVHTSPDGHVQR